VSDVYFRRIKVSRARREQSAERRAHAKCVARSVVRASVVKKSQPSVVTCPVWRTRGRQDGHPRATTNPRGVPSARRPPPRRDTADRDIVSSRYAITYLASRLAPPARAREREREREPRPSPGRVIFWGILSNRVVTECTRSRSVVGQAREGRALIANA